MSGKRLALRFSRGPEIASLSHRDAIALWEKALAASGLPLATADGRGGRARFSIVAPLPEGYTSEAEMLEMLLTRPTETFAVTEALNAALPPEIRVLDGRQVEKGSPTLQSQLRWAEYDFDFAPGVSDESLRAAAAALFARRELPWTETVDGKAKHFDLCALVDDITVIEGEHGPRLRMRLDASGNGTGRPDSVLAGLGVPTPLAKVRTRLIFSRLPQALLLWRRAGRFENPRPER